MEIEKLLEMIIPIGIHSLKPALMGLAFEVSFESGAAVRSIVGAAWAHIGLVSGAVGQLVFVTSIGIFGRTISVGCEGEVGHWGCVLWNELMGLSGCGRRSRN